MAVQPLDVEAEVNFECPVCFVTGSVLPTKYKCTNCDKKFVTTASLGMSSQKEIASSVVHPCLSPKRARRM